MLELSTVLSVLLMFIKRGELWSPKCAKTIANNSKNERPHPSVPRDSPAPSLLTSFVFSLRSVNANSSFGSLKACQLP